MTCFLKGRKVLLLEGRSYLQIITWHLWRPREMKLCLVQMNWAARLSPLREPRNVVGNAPFLLLPLLPQHNPRRWWPAWLQLSLSWALTMALSPWCCCCRLTRAEKIIHMPGRTCCTQVNLALQGSPSYFPRQLRGPWVRGGNISPACSEQGWFVQTVLS